MRRFVVWSFLSAVLVTTLAAVSPSAGQVTAGNAEERSQGKASSFRVNTVAGGLSLPWGLAFLPDGDALVSERDTGRLLRVESSGGSRPVGRIPEKGQGEGGLLGIALSPTYAQDRLVYAYYTAARDNRVVRFRLGERTLRPVVTGIPKGDTHNGGRIAFGPDGKLYIATGDARKESASQNKRSKAGKILRVNPDGSVPADNPFRNSRVFSLGHRNVQGLAWDAKKRLFATEFGQNTFDEVNRIRPGGNYGWPRVEGRENNPRFINPVATFRPSEASPSGATIPERSKIARWNGDFFMATLRGESLYRLELDGAGRVTKKTRLLKGAYGRLRHVATAPDGTLWVLTSNGRNDRVLRLAPAR